MFDNADLFTSRRNHFNRCYYWKKNDREIEMSADLYTMVSVDSESKEMCYEREPDGWFDANEISNYEEDNQIVGGTFMFDNNSSTLETNDNIPLLGVNDVIVYDNYVWRVVKAARKKRKRQAQFSKDYSYKTYITLKR